MEWLTGDWTNLGVVAAKAALMYVTALVALRLGERRTLAQWTIIDAVAAVGIGAIVGRTAIASGQSAVVGMVALVTLVVIHRVASTLRFNRVLSKTMDHGVRVLVEHGRLRRSQLRLCGLTDNDLYAELRQRGVFSLEGLAYVLYEVKGGLTVVPASDAEQDPELVRQALDAAAGTRAGERRPPR